MSRGQVRAKDLGPKALPMREFGGSNSGLPPR